MDVLSLHTWIEEFSEDKVNTEKLEEYFNFIKESSSRCDTERYFEIHHIVPKCIDRCNKFSDKVVKINGSDHFRAHLILVDCFKSNSYRRSLSYAVRQMCRDPKGLRNISPEDYEESRKKFSEGITGTKMSIEGRIRISKTLGDGRLKGENHPLYGKHHSDETKIKISESNRIAWTEEKKRDFSIRRSGKGNPCFGKRIVRSVPFSEDSRKKMSLSGKGKIWINNGFTSTKVKLGEMIPEGWFTGRAHFDHDTCTCLGKVWINNGEVNRKIDKNSNLPEGFVLGRLYKRRED